MILSVLVRQQWTDVPTLTLRTNAHKAISPRPGVRFCLTCAIAVRRPGDRATSVLCREIPQNLPHILQPDFDLGKAGAEG